MQMTDVKSSNIRQIGYDDAKSLLAVTFGSGKTYEYHGVTKDLHAQFMAAESKGRFFAANIKGKFAAPESES